MNEKIYDINFSCPHDEFMKELQETLDNYSSDMRCNSSENATKNGKTVYKIEITNQNVANNITAIFEKNQNNGDIVLMPSGYGKMGGTFWEHNDSGVDDSDNTFIPFVTYLVNKAKTTKGTFIAESGDNIYCIVNGNTKNAKQCIVDSDGNVYGSKEVKQTSLAGDNFSVQFNTPIGEWIKLKKTEDPRFAQVIGNTSTSLQDKMNFVGKYLIASRNSDMIDSEEFKDIFHQAGLIGFTDKECQVIYKLIV